MKSSHHSVVWIKTSSSRTNSNRISTSSSTISSNIISTTTNSSSKCTSNQTSNMASISRIITDSNNSCNNNNLVVISNSMTRRCSSKCICKVTNSSNSSNLSKTVLCSQHPKTPTKCSKWKLKMLRQPLPRPLQPRPLPPAASTLVHLPSKLPLAHSYQAVQSL